jgi:hypothetical protein
VDPPAEPGLASDPILGAGTGGGDALRVVDIAVYSGNHNYLPATSNTSSITRRLNFGEAAKLPKTQSSGI